MNEIVKLFKEDVLKGIHSLLHIARGSGPSDAKASISIGLLFVLSIVLAVIRSLYSPAGVGLVEHFISTFAILLSLYLVFGAMMLWGRVPLDNVSKYAAIVYTCLLATGISYFVSILLLRFFTVSFLDWIGEHIFSAAIRNFLACFDARRLFPCGLILFVW